MKDDQDILPKNTHPLPYVQLGMRVTNCVLPDGFAFDVVDIYEQEVDPPHGANVVTVVLRTKDLKVERILSNTTVRKEYRLLEDFDPGQRAARCTAYRHLEKAAALAHGLGWDLNKFQDRSAAFFLTSPASPMFVHTKEEP